MAVGAHPDDVELGCGATLAKLTQAGKKAVIVDLTEGELGTRGTVEDRYRESADAARILGVSERVNLQLRDGFFEIDEESILRLVTQIRRFRPDIILANAETDRHPDHGRAAELLERAVFVAGLRKVKTDFEGKEQDVHRPRAVYHYIQYRDIIPDVVVDVSNSIHNKMESIKAYASQFYQEGSNEPETPISSKQFLDSHTRRAAELGRQIGVDYGEGFTSRRYIGVRDISDLL
jgi:bacillithiol biosynthesis deacetylase BshB1